MNASKLNKGNKNKRKIIADPEDDDTDYEAMAQAAAVAEAESSKSKAKAQPTPQVNKPTPMDTSSADIPSKTPVNGKDEVKSGFSYEPGSDKKIAAAANEALRAPVNPNQVLNISREPTKEEVKLLETELDGIDWKAGISETNPNIALANAFEYHYLPLANPRKMMWLCVQKPAEEQAKRDAQSSRRKKNNKRVRRDWDPETVFVNMRFRIEVGSMQATLVWPISKVNFSLLQAGDWNGVESNRGKLYMKSQITASSKKILLTPEYFTVKKYDKKDATKVIAEYSPTKLEVKDAKGNVTHLLNGDFMKALEVDGDQALMLCEMIVEDHPEIVKKEKGGKPAYLHMIEQELFGSNISGFKDKYEAGLEPYQNMLTDGKITQKEYEDQQLKLCAKYCIDPVTGKVDEVKVKAGISKKDIAKKLKEKCYTKPLKKSKTTGIDYLAFEAKLVVNTTDAERKNPPTTFHNSIAEAVHRVSKGEKKLNLHIFDDLSDWGGDEAINQVLTDEEKEAYGIKTFDRMLDYSSKAGLVYKQRIFVDAPANTLGFAREFERILFYEPPSKEDISAFTNRVQTSTYVPPPSKIMWVPGASKFVKTEFTKDADDINVAELEAELERNMKEMKDKIAAKKNGGALPATAVTSGGKTKA